jgi:pimeloyl-ACP methyl ester carboxylesterase
VFGKELGITENPEMKTSPIAAATFKRNQQARDYTLRADTYLRELHQPVLAIFGGQDEQVDWRTSRRIFRESFELAGNKALTLEVFEHAGHNLYRNSDGKPEKGSRFVDGYIELMVDWLQAQKAPR